MAADVYEHLKEEHLISAFNEAKRVTKKVIMIKPCPRKDARETLHLTVWSMQKWKEFFESQGLVPMMLGEGEPLWHYCQTFFFKV